MPEYGWFWGENRTQGKRKSVMKRWWNMARKKFSQTEIEYLGSLPAVESVTENRITYSRDFQINCMSRYLQGERPSAIFTSAGLSPLVVGKKRVERNIARWKCDDGIMDQAKRIKAPGITPVDAKSHRDEIREGQIQSLICQVIALRDRVGSLEEKIRELSS